MSDFVTHRGGCHCGRVAFEVDAPADLHALDCNCSICRMTGFVHLIVPVESLGEATAADIKAFLGREGDFIELLKQSLGSGKRRPILQAPTGFGKTRLAAAVGVDVKDVQAMIER